MPSSTAEEPGFHEHWQTDDRQALDVPSDDEDIYRGGRPLARRNSNSTSSTSSSSSFQVGGRLGAIAAVVELAISRWARARSSSASSISTVTISRSQSDRRRHHPSLSNLQSVQSERDITARIKAREESRQSPRQFSLYLPPVVGPGDKKREGDVGKPSREQGIMFSTSLPLILERLDNAMKKSIKARLRSRSHKVREPLSVTSLPHHHYMLPDDQVAPRSLNTSDIAPTGAHKGKQNDATVDKMPARSTSDECIWWLDVSSPTWQDMRAIGKASRSEFSCQCVGTLMQANSCCISTL